MNLSHKILIIPYFALEKYPSNSRLAFNNFYQKNFSRFDALPFFGFLKKKTRLIYQPYNAETLYYLSFSEILGKENVYILGGLHDSFFLDDPSTIKYTNIENYPDSYGYQKPNFISLNDAYENIKMFDAILTSSLLHKKNIKLLNLAKKKQIKIAMLDMRDNRSTYFKYDKLDFFNNFDEKYFDLFFKKDYYFEYNFKNVFPLAPTPTTFKTPVKYLETKFNFFFKGRYRKNHTLKDRIEIADIINNKFNNNFIEINSNNMPNDRLENIIRSSKFLISPSGISWDSYRHSNYAKFCKPIILPEPIIHTVGKPFKDLENCITYKLKKSGNNFIISNMDEFIQKIELILNDEKLANKLGMNYYDFIMKNHLSLNRAKYLINKIFQLNIN